MLNPMTPEEILELESQFRRYAEASDKMYRDAVESVISERLSMGAKYTAEHIIEWLERWASDHAYQSDWPYNSQRTVSFLIAHMREWFAEKEPIRTDEDQKRIELQRDWGQK